MFVLAHEHDTFEECKSPASVGGVSRFKKQGKNITVGAGLNLISRKLKYLTKSG